MNKAIVLVLLMFSTTPVYAVQLDADISGDSIEPEFKFLRVVSVDYSNGGELAELLRGTQADIAFTVSSNESDLSELLKDLNHSILTQGSSATIQEIEVSYKAILSGNQNTANIEYKIDLEPKITQIGTELIDFQWRTFSIDKPILVGSPYGLYDINNPVSAIAILKPEFADKIADTKAGSLLSMPMLDASGLGKPLDQWHFLFDPIGILIPDMNIDTVVSQYSLGECTIKDAEVCSDRIWNETLDLDKTYTVQVIESKDDATITVLGYTELEYINGIQYMKTVDDGETGKVKDDLSVSMMYGMAAIAAVAGTAFFIFSNRKIKREQNVGQTGIDPANLITYSTSTSSGGYQTNRGESVLRDVSKKTPV